MIVNRSIQLSEPIVFVSMNYRLNGSCSIFISLSGDQLNAMYDDTILPGFGFLASQEVKDARAGNLGLHDRRYHMFRFFSPAADPMQNARRFAGCRSTYVHSVCSGVPLFQIWTLINLSCFSRRVSGVVTLAQSCYQAHLIDATQGSHESDDVQNIYLQSQLSILTHCSIDGESLLVLFQSDCRWLRTEETLKGCSAVASCNLAHPRRQTISPPDRQLTI
jgi:hypothetical protein